MPEVRGSVIPGMCYRDAPTAIEWICRVFGFERHPTDPGRNHTSVHAELTLGARMITLGSLNHTPDGACRKQPEEIGGAETRRPSLTVADADAAYARAKADGAEMILDVED